MSSGLLSSISLQSSQSKHFAMYVKKIFFNLSQKVIKMFKRDFRRIFSQSFWFCRLLRNLLISAWQKVSLQRQTFPSRRNVQRSLPRLRLASGQLAIQLQRIIPDLEDVSSNPLCLAGTRCIDRRSVGSDLSTNVKYQLHGRGINVNGGFSIPGTATFQRRASF